jgi:uncharacterized membrane protein YfcA
VWLALFALWCFTVAAAGGVVGLVLGNLRLPATLLVAAGAAAGTGANLLISSAAAGTAALAHLRGGRVDARLFAWMAPPSVLGALAGGYVSGVLPQRALLAVIALVLAHAAVGMFRWTPPQRAPGDASTAGDFDRRAAVVAGAGIGFLGGVVGLILGSLRMPALLKRVHVPAGPAAGTNLAVGFVVGLAGALGHLPSEPPDWTVAAVGTAASIPGALLGARLTGRLTEPQLVRALAWILVAVAVATAAEAVA